MTRNHIIGVAFVVLCVLFVATRLWVRKDEAFSSSNSNVQQAAPKLATADVPASGAGSSASGAPATSAIGSGAGSEAQALDYYRQGCAAYESKNMDQAYDLFGKAIQLNPNNAHFYNDMSAVCFNRNQPGDIQTAEGLLRKATELQPGNCDYWTNLARPLYAEKRYDEAKSALAKASRCNPTAVQSSQIQAFLSQLQNVPPGS